MNYKNPARRLLLRADFLKRLRKRLARLRRKVTKNEISDLTRLLDPSTTHTIIDVGASVGFVSWELSMAFRKATIYALEPDLAPRQVFASTHGNHPRIKLFPVAAADREGELTFIRRGVSCNSSLLNTADPNTNTDDTVVKVPTTTIDRFCEQQSISHIDFLKVDTEGADLLVLKGASGMLQSKNIDAIVTEVFFVPVYEGQSSFEDIAAFLRGFGFSLFNIYIDGETSYGQARYANILFAGPRFHPSSDKHHA